MIHCASSLVTPVSCSPKNKAPEKEVATQTVELYVLQCASQNNVRNWCCLDLAWGVGMFNDLYEMIDVNRPIECI